MQPNKFQSWREQKSSNGRIYYYNTTTEVSQWSKPTEWQEYEDKLKEQSRLEWDRDMQASVVMPPPNFPPPPPPFQFFPPHPMVGYQYPADVYHPYPTPPLFIPSSAPAHQFALPTLPVSKPDRPHPHVVRSSPSQSQGHPHPASTCRVTSISSKQENANYSKPHPYSFPSTIGITESGQPSTSTDTRMGLSAVTANGMSTTSRSTNDVPLYQEGEKRAIFESRITPGEPAFKKARPDMILGPDWQLQPWARFYKPELAEKLREKFNNDQPKELDEERRRSASLERKFLEQLKNTKSAAASTAIMKNKFAVKKIQTEVLRGFRVTLEADALQRDAALAEEEKRTGPGLRRRARYRERKGCLYNDNLL